MAGTNVVTPHVVQPTRESLTQCSVVGLGIGAERAAQRCQEHDGECVERGSHDKRQGRVEFESQCAEWWPDEDVGHGLAGGQPTVRLFQLIRGDHGAHDGRQSAVGDHLARPDHEGSQGDHRDRRLVSPDQSSDATDGQTSPCLGGDGEPPSIEAVDDHAGGEPKERKGKESAHRDQRNEPSVISQRDGQKREGHEAETVAKVCCGERCPEAPETSAER